MSEYRVMVTGAGGASGMGTIASLLRENDVKVIGADINNLAVGLYWCHERAILPRASSPDYIDKLIGLAKKFDVDVLIPNTSEEMYPISLNIERIEDHAGILISPPESIKKANDKFAAFETLSAENVPIVETRVITDEEDIKDAVDELQLPVAIKPRVSRGGRGLTICKTLDEARLSFRNLRKDLPFSDTFFEEGGEKDVICQEYLPGTEYDTCALFDKNDCLKASVPMKANIWDVYHQLREIVTEHNEIIEELVVESAKALGLIGPIDVEIRHTGDGIAKVLEVNPRCGGDIELAAASNCNIPYLATKLSLGEKVDYTDFEEEVILTRYIGFQCIKKEDMPEIE